MSVCKAARALDPPCLPPTAPSQPTAPSEVGKRARVPTWEGSALHKSAPRFPLPWRQLASQARDRRSIPEGLSVVGLAGPVVHRGLFIVSERTPR